MRGDGSLYLRGRIWWVQYQKGGRKVRESSYSPDKLIAFKLLLIRTHRGQGVRRCPKCHHPIL